MPATSPIATFKPSLPTRSKPTINTDVKLARGTKTCAPSAYPRNKIMELANSPLAMSSVPDPERVNRFNNMLAATPATTAPSDGLSMMTRDSPITANRLYNRMWGRPGRSNMNTPVTPWGDTSAPSLIRPASDMCLVTPVDGQGNANPQFASLSLDDSRGKDLAMARSLSVTAKEFVPSQPVMAKVEEQDEAVKGPVKAESTPKLKPAMPAAINIEVTEMKDDELANDMLKSSITVGSNKSTKIESAAAEKGHSLPDRPTLCALPPNLPKWAHATSDNKLAKGTMRPAVRPSMSRMGSANSVQSNTGTLGSLIEEGAPTVAPMIDQAARSWRPAEPTMVGEMLVAKMGDEEPAKMEVVAPKAVSPQRSPPMDRSMRSISPAEKMTPSAAVPIGNGDTARSMGMGRPQFNSARSTGSVGRYQRRQPAASAPGGIGLLGAVPMSLSYR